MIRFTKAKPTPRKPRQSSGKKATLNKLKSFLTAAEPETVEFLVTNWNAQNSSITYKELREAYLNGGMTQRQFEKWQADYAKLVNTTLAPQWQLAADTAAQEVKAQYPHFVYEPSVSAALDYIKQHGAELVTNLAQEQRDALNAMIYRCSGYTAVTPDEAARIIRPCIGLTKPQALANLRYREAVKAAYLKAHPHGKPETAEKKAAEAAARYAGQQHRYRAQCIARTELAYGYNAGAYGATKDAQAQGYIGDCAKVWLTAYDERVCPICSQMDDERRNMDEPFSNGKMLPPGHPQCRCAVAYEEIPNTNMNQTQNAANGQNAQAQQPQQAKPALTFSGVQGKLDAGFIDGMRDTLQRTGESDVVQMYDKFGADIRVVDANYTAGGAHFSRVKGGVSFDAKKVAAGGPGHLPYETSFHEFAHNIDYIAQKGKGGTAYISLRYKNGLLGRTIQSDWTDFIQQHALKTNVARMTQPELSQMLRSLDGGKRNTIYYAAVRSLRSGAMTPADVIQLHGKDIAAEYVRNYRTQVEASVVAALKKERMSLEKRGNISDIIEGCSGIDFPLGFGHGAAYHQTPGATAKEFFAEVCDSKASNPESIGQLRRIFPNAVGVVEDIIREVTK